MTLEVYILCPERSTAMAMTLADQVMPHRRPTAEDFPFPEFADNPDEVFLRPEDVIERLDRHPAEPYSLYWDNLLSDEPFSFMLFFTDDGALIAGVAVDDRTAVTWLERLHSLTGGKYGYITGEEAPPSSRMDFIHHSRSSTLARLVEGHLLE